MNNMKLSKELSDAVRLLRNAEIDAQSGLDEELFLLLSALTPIPNVDLLVVNSRNQLLLARRNDIYFDKSWHIPGGCIRYGEDFETRIQQTALKELGSVVSFDPEPLAVSNMLRKDNFSLAHPKERGHNIAILFRCWLPKGYEIDNSGKNENDDGYLKWFDRLPGDFLKMQFNYGKVLMPWKEVNKND